MTLWQTKRVISFDVYDTLFPVEPPVLRLAPKLRTRASTEWCLALWPQLRAGIQEFFEARAMEPNPPFMSARQIYKSAFIKTGLASELDLSLDDAAEVIATAHAEARPLEGSAALWDKLKRRYTHTAFASDADNDFLHACLAASRLSADWVVSSESAGGYKVDSGGVFAQLIRDSRQDADHILHVGDAQSDVTGANREGVEVWLLCPGSRWRPKGNVARVLESITDLTDSLL